MKIKFNIIAVTFFIIVSLTSLSLYSLPRFAAENSLSCITCHINPNGGGMRNEFGHVSTAYNELCIQVSKKHLPRQAPTTRLAENVTYGFDYRMLYLENGSFFRMQSDLYLSMEILKRTSFNFTINPTTMKESYLQAIFGDQQYWVKVGKFYPAYGLRNADHNAFVREVPQLLPELTLDGISVGGNFYGSNITIEHFQPADQAITSLHSFRTYYYGGVSILTGFSLRNSEQIEGSYRMFPISRAVFGGLSYKFLTLTSEYGQIGKGNEENAFYTQLAIKPIFGIYLIGEYNFHDSDRSLKTGVNEFYRFSVEFFPVPFIELRPSVTYYTEGPLKDETNYFLQLHINY